jgi:hypothetical protein
MTGFEQVVPFHHGFIGQPDLPEHGGPLLFAHVVLHCPTPLLIISIMVTAIAMPFLDDEPMVGSRQIFMRAFFQPITSKAVEQAEILRHPVFDNRVKVL